MKIRHRHDGSVIYEDDVPSMRETLENAIRAGTRLAGADLVGADLVGADLEDANLTNANLTNANLIRAYLSGANLAGANLTGANLTGANLTSADLTSADLTGANLYGVTARWAVLDGGKSLIGERPIFQIGPIGSEHRYLIAYITDCGLYIRAGRFFGSREEFEKLAETHGEDIHAQEYRAALALLEMHERLWWKAG